MLRARSHERAFFEDVAPSLGVLHAGQADDETPHLRLVVALELRRQFGVDCDVRLEETAGWVRRDNRGRELASTCVLDRAAAPRS